MARRLWIVLAIVALALTGCARPAPEVREVVREVTRVVTRVAKVEVTSAPEPTLKPEPTRAPGPASTSTAVPPIPRATTKPTDTPIAQSTATTIGAPKALANNAANLRAGPGTIYPVVGAAKPGDVYAITGRVAGDTWFEVCCVDQTPVWVASSLVTVGGDLGDIGLAAIPPTPIVTAVPTAIPEQAAAPDLPGWVEYVDPAGQFRMWYPPGWSVEVGQGVNAGTTLIRSADSGKCCFGYFSIKDGPGQTKFVSGQVPAPEGVSWSFVDCMTLQFAGKQRHVEGMICGVDAYPSEDLNIDFTVAMGNLQIIP
jgi:uncharacterized protein YraI